MELLRENSLEIEKEQILVWIRAARECFVKEVVLEGHLQFG